MMEASLKTAPKKIPQPRMARRARKMEMRIDKEKIEDYLASAYALGC